MLMGIDIGTTGTKVAIYSMDGKVLANGYSEYSVEHPKPTWAQQNPQIWLNALKGAISQSLKPSEVQQDSITGICVSGQAPTLVPVDADGQPVGPAMIWLDNRSVEESQIAGAKLGEDELYTRHGLRLAPSFPFPKILWLRKNRPELFAKVRWFHQAKDFVVSKLTDLHVTDVTHGTGYFCVDVKSQTTDYRSFELFDLDPDLVPAIKPCNEVVGETSSSAATYGIPAGVPVVNGAIDAIMAVVGMGVFEPNIVCEVAGTSTVLVNSTDKPLMDPTRRFLVNIHPLGKMWFSSSVINTTGAVLRWFRDQIWKPCQTSPETTVDPYKLFDEWIKNSPPGANGLLMLPYLQGERTPLWDPQAKGMFFGLTLQHNVNDMIRSIYEASAFVNVHSIEELNKLGLKPREVRISGGPSLSEGWNQIKADAYGIPLLRPNVRFPENQGDAILAGLATKQISLSSAKEWIEIDQVFKPNKVNTALYQKLLKIFIEIYPQTKTLMADLGSLSA